MADLNSSLAAARQLQGVLGMALVDLNSGICLALDRDVSNLARTRYKLSEVERSLIL